MIGALTALPIKNMLHLLSFYIYENKAMQDSIYKQHLIAILYLFISTSNFFSNTHIHVCNNGAKLYLKNQ